MRPEEPMAEALRGALEPRAMKLKKRLRKAARGDADAIHDARTTLRRLREGLVVMGRTVTEPSVARRLERGLHGLERILGATRDDDVLAADLDAYLRRAPRHARHELALLHDLLRRRRRRDARRLARRLAAGRCRRRVREVRRFLSDPARGAVPPPRNPAKAVPTLVRHFLPDETWHAYEEVVAYETHLPTGSAELDVIHKVRSSCRRLRYALELFAEALPPGVDEVVGALRALQDRLGELHDHAVAVDRVDRWLARGRLSPNPSLESYRASRAAQRDRLRAEFDAEWRALTGDAFRFALSHLVSGEAGPRSLAAGAVRLVA